MPCLRKRLQKLASHRARGKMAPHRPRWQGSYPFVSGYTLSLACMHCLNPECIRVCPTGAIKKHPDTGAVLWNPPNVSDAGAV